MQNEVVLACLDAYKSRQPSLIKKIFELCVDVPYTPTPV